MVHNVDSGPSGSNISYLHTNLVDEVRGRCAHVPLHRARHGGPVGLLDSGASMPESPRRNSSLAASPIETARTWLGDVVGPASA